MTGIERVRCICLALPAVEEKLSHGAPTFFTAKRVFATFVADHHGDGRVAVWIPALPGMQEILIAEAPDIYFRPPYVGVKGWVGVNVNAVGEDTLAGHLREAWGLIAAKKRKS